MAVPLELTVLSVPGLSARMLAEPDGAIPHIAQLAESSAATVIGPEGASNQQLETALFTGMLPEYGGEPFWRRGNIRAHVIAEYSLQDHWRALDPQPQLQWRTVNPPIDLAALDAEVSALHGSLVLVSAWAQVSGKPGVLDRPVLLIRGFDQPKTCVGILEIAGMLRRALTGEELNDAL